MMDLVAGGAVGSLLMLDGKSRNVSWGLHGEKESVI